ncbi:Uncharacterised protein [Vibrio cholerae]|nr:Uncharacterised protein [Vibrio cholerae]
MGPSTQLRQRHLRSLEQALVAHFQSRLVPHRHVVLERYCALRQRRVVLVGHPQHH